MSAVHTLTVIEPPLPRPVRLVGVGIDPTDWDLLGAALPDGVRAEAVEAEGLDPERLLREGRPDLVLLPFGADPRPSLALAAALQVPGGPTLLAVAQAPDPGAIREAMRGGFRDFLVLPDDLAALRRCVREVSEAAAATPEPAQRGRSIAVMGAKGGTGATLLAVNLAADLARSQDTLVLDMDFGLGDAAVFLDLSTEHGMNDVIRNVARLDSALLASALVTHSPQLRVLAQPELPIEELRYDSDAVLRTLDLSAGLADVVVVDCGSSVTEASMAAASEADRVVLVCTPDVPAVRAAWVRLQLLDRLGVPNERVALVVNRWGPHAGLTRREIEEHLGLPVCCTLNDDPKATAAAINDGLLLRDRNPRGKLCRDIAHLAAELTGGSGQTRGGGRARWFSWGGRSSQRGGER